MVVFSLVCSYKLVRRLEVGWFRLVFFSCFAVDWLSCWGDGVIRLYVSCFFVGRFGFVVRRLVGF